MNDNQTVRIFEVIKAARTNPIQQIETMATDLHMSQHVSPLDACKCTGNCDSSSLN